MFYCSECGQARQGEARFCGACGAALEVPMDEPTAASSWRAAATPDQSADASESTRPETTSAVRGADASTGVRADTERPRSPLPWAEILPMRAWTADRSWLTSQVVMFLVAAIVPFVLLHVGTDRDSLREVSWGYALYFALLWLLAIGIVVRPERVRWTTILGIAVFTALVGTAIAVFLERHFASDTPNVVQYVLAIGLPEEIAKLLPIYLIATRISPTVAPRTYLYLGAVSGLAFGAAEAVSYTQLYAGESSYLGAWNTLVTGVWRLVTDSLFHACMAGIAAFFLGLARVAIERRVALLATGIGLASVLHGVYDATASTWFGAAIAAVIVAVFVAYARTGDAITRKLVAYVRAHTGAQPESRSAPEPGR